MNPGGRRHPKKSWVGRGGRKVVEKSSKKKVLRMGFSIVENLSGLQESIFSLSRRPQLHSGEKSKKWSNVINLQFFTVFFRIILRGPPWVGGTGAALSIMECQAAEATVGK